MRVVPVLTLVVAACSGHSPPRAPHSEAEPAAAEPEPPAPVLETPRAALAYLAADSDIVIGLDVAGLMSAQILAPYRDQLLAEAPPELRELRERCNFDPFADLRWVIFGLNSQTEKGVAVIRGDFTEAKIARCLEVTGAGATVREDGDLRIYASEDGKLIARWLGPGAVVATSADNGGAATLERALAGGGLAAPVAARVDQIDNGSHVWLVSGQQAFGQASVQGATGLRVFARATDILSAGVIMDFESAAGAESTRTQLDQARGQLKAVAPELVPIGEALDLAVVGAALEARIELTADQLEALAQFLDKAL